ncbi:MoaD/ThiS family protein [Fulvivirga sediminis]|uniref:Molybdopterin synthase sulfur carrier subunit n=1 Tax=Fulvivirga sediminis TaxID=2803949 RepID=A0A937F9V8_9BACT|nr:MoaD/ThiS family protein [Fulvivirga sediminis]MBL3657667.1 MoaD/ThiS family protein [Fulvivirga sediminis]
MSNSVTVKYFGAIAEQTGISGETLELTHDLQNASQIKAYCIHKYNLNDQETIQVAINQELNDQGTVKEGDEIALLPPFAGG